MTSTPNNSRVQDAINAACEVATQQGLKFKQAIALQDRSNLVIHHTTQGVLWTDWEDTFVGHISWNIACLIASSRVFGTEIANANAALAGYGLAINEELLDFFIEARTFQTAAWNSIIGQQHPQSLAHLEGKLDWFRARFPNI